MNRLGLIVGSFLIGTSCSPVSQLQQQSTVRTESISEAKSGLEKLAEHGFKGSVLVACGSSIILQKDYGLPLDREPVTRYEIASISKLLTSIAILKLVDENRLQLTDKIPDYFPSAPENFAGITLLQLLTHQSGLSQNYAAEGQAQKDEAAAAIFSTKLVSAPGAEFHYSNDNFSLLAIILEDVSGLPYKSYLNKVISQPLGLAPIQFWPDPKSPDEYLPPLLNSYGETDSKLDWGFLGGHGARLSVIELFAIITNLENGKLLSEKSLELLHGPHVTSSGGRKIGMGWYSKEDSSGRRLSYTAGSDQSGGNAIGYKVDDDGLLIIAATNNGPDEKTGPGWSRQARDILIENFARSETKRGFCAER